jgi:Na+-translocating ferredoxin:NAD+ oxidoreductase subunit B
MDEAIYRRLAGVLDRLPNGFPATDSGVEIRLLKKIFTPEQAELFCHLRLTFETAEQIAARTGLPGEGLRRRLMEMALAGQLFTIKLGDERYFKMLPWVFGIYEFQGSRMDEAFAALCAEYAPVFGRQFFSGMPQLMHVLPVEDRLPEGENPLPYERVSALLESGQSFLVNDCICKKEQGLLGRPCDRPLQVCLAVAPIPGVFDNSPVGRVVTRQEAYGLLKKTEALGLVHLASNVQYGGYYICNCCKCCCGVLRAINELGLPAARVVNCHYVAEIDPENCTTCGICADERCQVAAIEAGEEAYRVIPERCIGCGLCVTTCPTEAIRLHHKAPEALTPPPLTEDEWFELRGKQRGVDFSAYK